jgi:putative ABC transport system substrate-binding protein
MKRRAFVRTAAGSALALLAGARIGYAQPKTARIGFLVALAADDPEIRPRLAAFDKALRDLGWADGRNLRIEYRYAAGDTAKMRQHAAELVALAPDVMIVHSNQALAVMRQVDRRIPTVFLAVSDPVGDGFVASLSRPGGNATGFANYEPEMGSKWLQVLKELAPATTRVMVLLNPKIAANVQFSRTIESAAAPLGVRATVSPTTDGAEMRHAIAEFARERNGGLIALPNPSNRVHGKLIIDACALHRLPAVHAFPYVAKVGGLAGYGLDQVDMFRNASAYVDRILKGAAPAEMPVQLPTRFELAINLRTAKSLGLTIPSGLLAQANEVVE